MWITSSKYMAREILTEKLIDVKFSRLHYPYYSLPIGIVGCCYLGIFSSSKITSDFESIN